MGPKLITFAKKTKFLSTGAPPPDSQNSPLQIFDYAPESNHVFALLILNHQNSTRHWRSQGGPPPQIAMPAMINL